MADAVTTDVLRAANGNYTYRLTNASDGTGEDTTGQDGVTKIDVSSLLSGKGLAGEYTSILHITYSVWGFNYVTLYFDSANSTAFAIMKGNGIIDASMEGGIVDPLASGYTGDVTLLTDGGSDGSGYDMTIRFKVKDTA